jgi:hypothetical protein
MLKFLCFCKFSHKVGLSLSGELKAVGKGVKWLYPVRNLSHVFRAKFMTALGKHPKSELLQTKYKQQVKTAWKKTGSFSVSLLLASPNMSLATLANISIA